MCDIYFRNFSKQPVDPKPSKRTDPNLKSELNIFRDTDPVRIRSLDPYSPYHCYELQSKLSHDFILWTKNCEVVFRWLRGHII